MSEPARLHDPEPKVPQQQSLICSGGLEPDFRVLVSALFHPIAQENCHRGGKQWNLTEAKVWRIVADLRTLFFCIMISDQGNRQRVSGFFELGSTK